MERLTVKWKPGLYDTFDPIDVADNEYSKINFEKLLTRLGEYEDAEEQGLLLRLPCKVGDKVYLISHATVDNRRKPLKCNIDDFVIERSGCFAILNGNGSYYMLGRFKAVNINDFGRIVFLTESEAEAALAEKGE